MTKIYKTVLGIAYLSTFAIVLALIILQLINAGHLYPPPLLHGSVYGLLFYLLYWIIEFLFLSINKNTNLFKAFKIGISIVLIPITLYFTYRLLKPDRSTSRDIIYILPSNFKGTFTINYKIPEEISNAIESDESTVTYRIPPSGVFNSSQAYLKPTNGYLPQFYIETIVGLKELNYTFIPVPSLETQVYDGNYEENIFGSIDAMSYVVDPKLENND